MSSPATPWPLPEGDAERLALAKTYPFPAPEHSFLFDAGEFRLLEGEDGRDPTLYEGRTPVLAHGSNRSPEQLARKYGIDAVIPVTRGWLKDYDVVYSAHITQYGAVASTVQYAPGVRSHVSVTWLDPAQLERMHETEGPSSYEYGALFGIDIRLNEAGPVAFLHEACLYLSRNGCLAMGEKPCGLAAVEAEGRHHPTLLQEAALESVRARHRAGEDLDAMILTSIADFDYRKALVADLKAEAVASRAPHFAPA